MQNYKDRPIIESTANYKQFYGLTPSTKLTFIITILYSSILSLIDSHLQTAHWINFIYEIDFLNFHISLHTEFQFVLTNIYAGERNNQLKWRSPTF